MLCNFTNLQSIIIYLKNHFVAENKPKSEFFKLKLFCFKKKVKFTAVIIIWLDYFISQFIKSERTKWLDKAELRTFFHRLSYFFKLWI